MLKAIKPTKKVELAYLNTGAYVIFIHRSRKQIYALIVRHCEFAKIVEARAFFTKQTSRLYAEGDLACVISAKEIIHAARRLGATYQK